MSTEHHLPDSQRRTQRAEDVDNVCDAFELAWLAGQQPRIEKFLHNAEEPLREELLRELLLAEIGLQLDHGRCPNRDDYLRRFPAAEDWIEQALRAGPAQSDDAFMATPRPDDVDTCPDCDSRGDAHLRDCDVIKGFEIVRELHRGGQGIVYQAIQLSTKRKVALKVMLEGPFAGSAKRRRFEREVELIGSLRHPGIVPIFDSGVAEGRFYYAMEYIRGKPLTESVKSRQLNVDETLRLFAKVCEAVSYAHQRGVIHRDLKPSNILVDDRGVPYILDFGLAKTAGAEAERRSLISVTGQVIGTVAYMSPEQAAGGSHEVDVRSDVYALGMILYELLTDQPPYDVQGSIGEVLHTIQHVPPARPRRAGRPIANELETIVFKALDKDKERRYDTAGALGRDIERFLEGKPIEAKRDSVLYVLRKTLRRYRTVAAVVTTFLLMIFASLVALSILYYRAEQEAERARLAAHREATAREETRQQLYISDMNSAADAWESWNLPRMYELLDRHRHVANEEDFYGFEWNLLWEKYLSASQRTRLRHNDEVRSAVFTPDGRTLVTTTKDSIRVWDVATRRELASRTGDAAELMCLALSPDGKTLASGHKDGVVVLWDFATRQPLLTLAGYQGGISQLAFSPDNSTLAAAGFKTKLKLWDVDSGRLTHEEIGLPSFWGLSTTFSPDSKRLVVGSQGVVHLWELASPYEEIQILHDKTEIRCVAVSPDGRLLAIGGDESVLRFHDLVNDRLRITLKGHLAQINCGTFSPDGKSFATGSSDRTVRLWNVETGEETAVLRGHTNKVICVAFSPDRTTLASGSGDRDVILWDVDDPDSGRLRLHQSAVQNLAFNPDGTKLASAGFRQHPSLVLWDVATGHGEVLTKGNLKAQCVAFSPIDNTLVAGIESSLRIWDLAGQTSIERTTRDGEVVAVALSPNGKLLASAARSIVRIWNTETWNQIENVEGPRWIHTNVAFSPNGELFATPTGHSQATLYDTKSWNKVELPTPIEHVWPITDVAFSPDGQSLATVCSEGLTKVWDLATLRERFELSGETFGLYCVAYSPDGRTLVTGGIDGRINIWKLNFQTPQLVAVLRGHGASISRLAFSADGKVLATASDDGTVRLWRTAREEEIEDMLPN